VLGFGRLILELNAPIAWAPAAMFAEINFLHFAVLLFAISVVALIAVSLATAAPDEARLQNLTIATLKPVDAADQGRERAARRSDIALSLLLLFIIAAIWTIFSG
jgi:SSS family solute:Na+ symporter